MHIAMTWPGTVWLLAVSQHCILIFQWQTINSLKQNIPSLQIQDCSCLLSVLFLQYRCQHIFSFGKPDNIWKATILAVWWPSHHACICQEFNLGHTSEKPASLPLEVIPRETTYISLCWKLLSNYLPYCSVNCRGKTPKTKVLESVQKGMVSLTIHSIIFSWWQDT